MKCNNCGITIPELPEDADYTEMLCDRCEKHTWQLGPQEKETFRCLLKNYFPELGTDEEMSGADVVQELCRIYEELSK